METKEFQEGLVKHFKMNLKRKTELLDKISEFVQENEITKEEWFEVNKMLEGKE